MLEKVIPKDCRKTHQKVLAMDRYSKHFLMAIQFAKTRAPGTPCPDIYAYEKSSSSSMRGLMEKQFVVSAVCVFVCVGVRVCVCLFVCLLVSVYVGLCVRFCV